MNVSQFHVGNFPMNFYYQIHYLIFNDIRYYNLEVEYDDVNLH